MNDLLMLLAIAGTFGTYVAFRYRKHKNELYLLENSNLFSDLRASGFSLKESDTFVSTQNGYQAEIKYRSDMRSGLEINMSIICQLPKMKPMEGVKWDSNFKRKYKADELRIETPDRIFKNIVGKKILNLQGKDVLNVFERMTEVAKNENLLTTLKRT